MADAATSGAEQAGHGRADLREGYRPMPRPGTRLPPSYALPGTARRISCAIISYGTWETYLVHGGSQADVRDEAACYGNLGTIDLNNGVPRSYLPAPALLAPLGARSQCVM
eukprot:546380-Rhodomonas_salina.1